MSDEGAVPRKSVNRNSAPGVARSRMLTVPQTAARLRDNGVAMSKDVIYDMVRADAFPHVRAGRRVLVPVAALERWMDGTWRPPGAGPPASEDGGPASTGGPRPHRRRLRIVHGRSW